MPIKFLVLGGGDFGYFGFGGGGEKCRFDFCGREDFLTETQVPNRNSCLEEAVQNKHCSGCGLENITLLLAPRMKRNVVRRWGGVSFGTRAVVVLQEGVVVYRTSKKEVPERGDFGEENRLGKGGGDRAKKRKKGCAEKGGILLPMVSPFSRAMCARNILMEVSLSEICCISCPSSSSTSKATVLHGVTRSHGTTCCELPVALVWIPTFRTWHESPLSLTVCKLGAL